MCCQHYLRISIISAPPEPPSRPEVTEVTSRSITLTWSSPSTTNDWKLPISDYVITIYEGDSTEFRMSSVGPLHTNSSLTTITVDGLQPATVYAFVVQAVNSFGLSNSSMPSYSTNTRMESKYNGHFKMLLLVSQLNFQSRVVNPQYWRSSTLPPPQYS